MPVLGGFGSGGVSRPVPSFGRMMVFVDGENLALRYQDMIKQGKAHKKDVKHKQDVYVWSPKTVRTDLNEVIRCTYYTSTEGSDEVLQETIDIIKLMSFSKHEASVAPNHLYPKVFHKNRKERKSKGVDIQMTVDILTNVFQNNLDVVYLVSGDGDYKPIIEECIRYGKQVYIAAFSSGLNKSLKNIADVFIDLDKIYFEP